MGSQQDGARAPSIEVKSLSYAFVDGSSGLKDINLSLPASSRTLLIGGMFSVRTIIVTRH